MARVPTVAAPEHAAGFAWAEQPIEQVGAAGFTPALLRSLSRMVGADHCAAFGSLARRDAMACLLVDSRSDPEGAHRSAKRYIEAYWPHDPVVAALPHADGLHVVHQTWDAIPHRPFREECYRLKGVVDRLSVVRRRGGETLVVSVFRCRGTGFFSEGDAGRLAGMAPVLAALVHRHAGLAGPGPDAFAPPCGLSAREWEVAARLARGETLAEAAVELGISAHSAETYRRRLYGKLEVDSRVGLLARLTELGSLSRVAGTDGPARSAAG